MSLNYVKFSPGFEAYMPKEYRDMVEHGPFGKKTTVSQMGSFEIRGTSDVRRLRHDPVHPVGHHRLPES